MWAEFPRAAAKLPEKYFSGHGVTPEKCGV